MNPKKSILLSAALLASTAMAASGYSNIKRVSTVEHLSNTNMTAQVSPEDERLSIFEAVFSKEESVGLYVLRDPNFSFSFNPNAFVLELLDGDSETAQSTIETPPTKLIHFWSKEDYVILKSAGDEIGDFPPKLRLSVYENPEKLSLEDWITTQGGSAFQAEVENVRKSDTTVAQKEAWTFSYTSLFEYDSIAFENTEEQIIVLSLGLPVRESNSDSETIEDDEDYLTAMSLLVATIVPTMDATDDMRESP